MSKKYGDLSGKEFGYLTIIDRVEGKGRERWNYLCKCGRKGVIVLSNLVRHHGAEIRSCGCGPRKKSIFFSAGDAYNRWTLVEETTCPTNLKQNKGNRNAPWWICKCECGKIAIKNAYELKYGKSKSCSCYGIKKASIYANLHTIYPQKHGLRKNEDLYQLWQGILRKCTKKDSEFYHLYGGQGIKICDEWLEAQQFIEWAKKSRTIKNSSLELHNNSNEFSPTTVYWIPKAVKISKTKRNIGPYAEMLGNRYNNLVVVGEKYETSSSGFRRLKKICLCDCGRYTTVVPNALVQGHTKSCGCRGGFEWSVNFESCSNCGRTDSPCTARETGLCLKCYRHIKIQGNTDYKPSDYDLGLKWSKYHEHCILCKTTEVKHICNGLCKKCATKASNNKKNQKLRRQRLEFLKILQNFGNAIVA